MDVLQFYPDQHENYSIKEISMKLSADQKLELHKRLESLSERAPSLSSIFLTFIGEHVGFKGKLSIIGLGKNFTATFSGKDPLKIYEKLEQNIDDQLYQWKRTRFLSDCPKPELA